MKRGKIRTRLQKLEESLNKSNDAVYTVVMYPGETEDKALERHPKAKTAGTVVFVESFGTPGQGPPEETEDIDQQIKCETEFLLNHGFSEQEISEGVKTQAVAGAEGSHRIKGSRNRPARPADQCNSGNGNRARTAGQGVEEPGIFSSDLGKLFR